MKKLLFAAGWLCLAHSAARGQISPLFENLNFSNCSSGYFWTQSGYEGLPPDGSSYEGLSHDEARSVLFGFRKADISPENTLIPDYPALRAHWNNAKQAESVIPIAIADMNFERLNEASITNGWIYATPGGLFQQPGQNDLFETESTLTLFIDVPEYRRGEMYFRLDPSDYFQNKGGLPSLIRMDFDDGAGWRTIVPGERFAVNYSSAGAEKNIRLEVTRGNQLLKTGYRMYPVICESEYDDPDPNVPWGTTGNPEMPWEISVETAGTTVYGNAYYLPSGAFDKPFIFVEGIDFEYEVSADRNGSFGWCEFTSGINDQDYPYAMLHRMPELLDEVRANGYDVILLDFRDGATWIENNSMLLVHLIEMVNAAKVEENPLVVAGASMGGQITRYALTWMEMQGIDHCTRLWISLDSPHTGAYIPLALQQVLSGMSTDFSGAADFLNNYLRRPAARQLLNVQYVDAVNSASIFSPPIRNEWYATIDAMGYPKNCRKVGIANGNMEGLGIGYAPDEPLLNYSCEAHVLMSGPEVKYYMLPSSGDPYYLDDLGFQSNVNNDVIAQVIYTIRENPSALGSLFALLGIEVTKTVKTYWAPADTPNLDYAPGGTRKSMVDFVRSVNHGLNYNSNCPNIEDYAEKHTFIPTASALGIYLDDPYANVREFAIAHPELCPFDRIHGSSSGNEAHSEISTSNLEVVLSEILGGEFPGGDPVLPAVLDANAPNGSHFNYGKEYYAQLPSLEISFGGHISINKNEPTHYGEEGDEPPSINYFSVSTLNSCQGSEIILENVGILEIGDPGALTRGELIIGKGSSLTLRTAGALCIHSQSQLIIEDGGYLRMEPGSLLKNMNGSIIVKPGGRIYYEGGIWEQSGENAVLALVGGQLHIADEVTLEFMNNGTSGYVHIGPEAEQELFLGHHSVLSLSGTGPYDLMLRIADWANLWNGNFGQGLLKLENCYVDLENNGQLWTDMGLWARRVNFVDESEFAGQSTIQVWYNKAMIRECIFYNTKLITQDTHLKASMSRFVSPSSGIEVNNGRYSAQQCDFIDCGIESNSLENLSTIMNCFFSPNLGYPNGGIVVSDQSLATLQIVKSTFIGGTYGVEKSGGTLRLSCNDFFDNGIAVAAYKGCIVNMDAQSYSGYNHFNGNNQNIYLEEAGGLNLNDGYNQLGGFGEMNISGSIAGIPCPDDCSSPALEATHNIWSNDGSIQDPDPAFIDLRSGSYSIVCSAPPVFFNCPLEIFDAEPTVPADCQQHKNPVQITKMKRTSTYLGATSKDRLIASHQGMLKSGEEEDPGNPELSTTHFTDWPLDSALVFAATRMEVYDSLGNDLEALNLFHEILTSGLNWKQPEVRWKMIWGRERMKSTFESLVAEGHINPEEETSTFSTSTQHYVDVLNLMTDTVLTDSTYKSQFYLELDKGQLFRTLGRTDLARDIFIHLGDCQLDSLEQSILNEWRAAAESELLIREGYLSDGLAPDDIDGTADTTGYHVPINYVADDYYFGLWIEGPDQLSFVGCQSGDAFKSAVHRPDAAFMLYPNPANQQVQIKPLNLIGLYRCELVDIGGHSVFTGNMTFDGRNPVQLTLPTSLSPGMYVVQLSGSGQTHRQMLCVH